MRRLNVNKLLCCLLLRHRDIVARACAHHKFPLLKI